MKSNKNFGLHNLVSLLDSGRHVSDWWKLTIPSSRVQLYLRRRSVGSFPEQRLVIEPKHFLTFLSKENSPYRNYKKHHRFCMRTIYLYNVLNITLIRTRPIGPTMVARGGGVTPYNGLYGEAPPERGTFFRLQVYKRVGIPQV